MQSQRRRHITTPLPHRCISQSSCISLNPNHEINPSTVKQLVTTLLIAALLMTGCCNMPQTPVENGVSKQLAQLRKSHITNINYKLFFSVPLSSKEDIMGREDLFFNLKDRKQDLQIDFKESKEHIHKIICNGNVSNFQFTNEHILLTSSSGISPDELGERLISKLLFCPTVSK